MILEWALRLRRSIAYRSSWIRDSPRRKIDQITRWLATPAGVWRCGEVFFWLKGRRGSRQLTNLSQVKRLLVVRLDGIGDVVMTSSLLRELRSNLPKAWITLVVSPRVYNIVEKCPYVNEVLTFDYDVPEFGSIETVGPAPHIELHKRALRLARRHLWKRRFDLAVLPRWDADRYHGTYLSYFSGAPWRIGYSDNRTWRSWPVYDGLSCLLTHVIEDEHPAHEVQRNLTVIGHLKGKVESDLLELWVDKADEQCADRVLRSNRVSSDEILIAFGLGAGHPKRTWPIENFVNLGKWVSEVYGARVLLIGGESEADLACVFQEELGLEVINVIGKRTLRETTALLKRCDLFIGNDSGPLHIAAAVSKPVIEISCYPSSGSPLHPNSPSRFGPWATSQVVLQPDVPVHPCIDECSAYEAHCIRVVSLEMVKSHVCKWFKFREELMSSKGNQAN